MKKTLLFAAAVLLTANLYAQNSNVRFGLTASPQISWMTASDPKLQGKGSYFGFAYGLLADFKIPDHYAFSTGIIISYRGGKLAYVDSTQFNSFPNTWYPGGTEADYRLQYVEVPLTLRLFTNEIGYITYFGQFGLEGAVNIRSRADLSTPGGAMDVSKVNFGKDVTPADVALLVGAGIEYDLSGNTQLLVALQFANGFIDVTDNPGSSKSKSTSDHLRLELGVLF